MTAPAAHHSAVESLPARRLVAAAFLGGTLGSLARGGAELAFLSLGLSAWGSRVAVNLVGAFLIGCLFARIASRDESGAPAGIPHSHRMREHFLGAGCLGGFTTVSGMALDVASALGVRGPWAAAAPQPALADTAFVLAANATMGMIAAAAGWRVASPKQRAHPR